MDAKPLGEKVEIKELKEGDELHCLTCEAEITLVADLQNKQPIKKGNIVICAECAAIHKVGDSDLVKFTKEDFKLLDQQSRVRIAQTVAMLLAQHYRRNN